MSARRPLAVLAAGVQAAAGLAATTANGTVVQLYDCNGSGARQWQVGSNGAITNPQSVKCLDANGSGNGSALQIWSCGGTANQQWTVNGTNGGGANSDQVANFETHIAFYANRNTVGWQRPTVVNRLAAVYP